MSVISIALVDDHRVIARSLQAYLESFPDLKIAGIAASGEELLAHLDEWQPDVVLQDLLLPGGIDGIETTRRVLQLRPSVRVIAFTASMDEVKQAYRKKARENHPDLHPDEKEAYTAKMADINAAFEAIVKGGK